MDRSRLGCGHDNYNAPPDGAPVNGMNGPQAGRRGMRTGTCIALIVIGAILRFAVTAGGSSHGVNVHVVGVILILAGVLGLVLSLFVWGPLNPSRRRRDLPLGYDDGMAPVIEERRIYQDQPPVVEERRIFRDQPPVVEERRIYQEQPPVVEERRIFRDQSPL
jgi:hypothetical protein